MPNSRGAHTAGDAIRERIRIRASLPAPAERRALRVAAGLSQVEMADAVGVTKQAVANWEAGIRTPRGVSLERYVDALEALREVAAQ
ncbi:helix-turn-helix transcriptional regulator [Streptomyces sp. NPDC004227]